jgi:hypothetical protein
MVAMATDSSKPPGKNASDPLQKNLDWYIANQQELSAKFDGKVLLIVDQKLIAAFESVSDAYVAAIKDYAPGSFTLQPCSTGPESYTLVLYNPWYNIAA